MKERKWLDLQLFGGEGASGGDGGASAGDGGAGAEAATSAVSADLAEQRLLELGVPADKIKTRAKKAVASQMSARTAPKVEEKIEPQVADAEETPTENESHNISWDEFMALPENNKRMQETVQGRLKTAKVAEENLAKLTPAIEILARHHGINMENLDYEALAKAVSEDGSYYERKAEEMGVSVETAMKIDRAERDDARRQKEKERTIEEQKIRDHIVNLHKQGEELKKTFPTFDLKTELQNPVFKRLTAPGVNIPVADAYYAAHREEIQQATMKAAFAKAETQVTNEILSGKRRPQEAGTSAQAPSATTFDYRKATPEQRAAFKKQLQEGWAKGEKMYPGTIR